MKYLKIPITKTKDKIDDAITHYEYDDMDSLEFEGAKMTPNEKFLFVKVNDKVKEGKKTKKITKQEYDSITI